VQNDAPDRRCVAARALDLEQPVRRGVADISPLRTHGPAAGVMSASFPANQYERPFSPKSLCNWEVPANRLATPAPRAPGFRTTTIVDDNGHLLPGVTKRMTSFTPTVTYSTHKSRWPSASYAPFSGAATMGYKGIQTDYLPTTTVFMRNNPDSFEFNYK